MLRINELFVTIQGEGSFTGYPSIFIRLQGCNVGCAWCDTKHTWDVVADDEISLEYMFAKDSDSSCYASVTSDTLVNYILANYPQVKHIVITGGEPAIYDLILLTTLLINHSKSVQLETSGTSEILVHPDTWVTLSPKIMISPDKKLLDSSILRANEIKFPIGKMADIDMIHKLVENYPILNSIQIWLQPISQNKTALALCIEQSIKNNWYLSVQVHKYIYIR